ncbi:MAG TPA: LysM peptidoglycan-binding domain-containing protein [Candidatus Kaiserbacteria bacterium]|nr:LysM peptidoglycan-binding domain-containing protein [Candidatus Kaiserbacteria bacterium]
MTKNTRTRFNTVSFLLLHFVIVALFIVNPIDASAGIMSFFNNILSTTGNSIHVYNSQNALVLKAALNVDPNPSKGGGGITIVDDSALLSETGPQGTLADIEERSHNSGRISIYIVREGDSLSQIANMFGVSTGTIIWANDIKRGSFIREGQTLVILPISGVQHTVKKGDTLKGLVKKYKGNLKEVIQYNNLTKDTALSIGDVITIPGGEIKTQTYSKKARSRRVVRGLGGPTYSGYYIRPVTYARKSQGLHGYNAVDLAAPIGTPILASASGKVIISRGPGWNGGYGTYVVIRHENGTQTLYAHNSRNIVYVGQYVVQGQVIGYVGNTGRSTGPHTHFEIRGAKNPF